VLFKPNFYGYTESEIKQYLMARAIEWNTWPGFLSQPIVPLLLLFYKWWLILLVVLFVAFLWSFIKYKYINVELAEFGIFFTKLKWITIPVSVIYLIFEGRYGLAILAFIWPFIASGLGAGGRIGDIERTFAKKLGFIPDK
jgi:hypothetical protein